MAGHSKWKNIAHRKGKQDASKGQLFTKLCRDIYTAARRGGANPETNYHLKMALEKARAASVPNDTIARTIGKATGTLEGIRYEDLLYEGYGPGGVAIMVELSTSNRNRTAAEMRHLFSKYGGSLGETGCVAWMFKRMGVLSVPVGQVAMSEEDFTLAMLDAGIDDFEREDDQYILSVNLDQLASVEAALQRLKVHSESAQIAYIPTTWVDLQGDEAERVVTLIGILEEHEDVQSVFSNARLPDEMDEE
ncbi:YebC/PmpR family DNA-binding transcriptional regulator [Sulfoacidibacillus thermotolerans]|uniref:Probable transcriptional regulatory protein BM613_03060 n=1 Tax=Sulfoacidibacillus thermotolerans TaxID=1765684 RepID=A0A2U3DB63_SULT2|nr:YebC/PmpR family DNA-binding transcriptional regulator [Sulfoacidibacillus thermotolerans]PWI58514.1 transcriptional regulator [Sulfoacidibacillus thermotolerans]